MKLNFTLASFLVLFSSSIFSQNWEYVDYTNEATDASHFHLTDDDMVFSNWYSSRPIKFFNISTDPNNAYLTSNGYIEDEQYNLGDKFFDRSSDLSTLVIDINSNFSFGDSTLFFRYNGSEYVPVDTTDFGMGLYDNTSLSSSGDTALVYNSFGTTGFELFKFDGSDYQNISSYFSGGPDHQSSGVIAVSEDYKTFVTGDFFTGILNGLYHFDGAQWNMISLPNAPFWSVAFVDNGTLELEENDEIVRYEFNSSTLSEVSRRPTIDSEIDDSNFHSRSGISTDRDTYLFTDESGNSPVVKVYEWNGTDYIQRGSDIVPVELDIPASSLNEAEIEFEITPNKNGLILKIIEVNQIGSELSSHLEYFVWNENASVSVDEKERLDFSIFPNPAQDNLQVNGLEKEAKYSIYTITGKQMDYGLLMPFDNQINIEALPSGVYFVEVAGTAKKFIKR